VYENDTLAEETKTGSGSNPLKSQIVYPNTTITDKMTTVNTKHNYKQYKYHDQINTLITNNYCQLIGGRHLYFLTQNTKFSLKMREVILNAGQI
jgi:hypothetical protein